MEIDLVTSKTFAQACLRGDPKPSTQIVRNTELRKQTNHPLARSWSEGDLGASSTRGGRGG